MEDNLYNQDILENLFKKSLNYISKNNLLILGEGGRAFEKNGPGSRIQELHSKIHGMKSAASTYNVLINFVSKVMISTSKL